MYCQSPCCFAEQGQRSDAWDRVKKSNGKVRPSSLRHSKAKRGRIRMKIYIAHQITGLTFDEVVNYYNRTTRTFQKMGYKVLCPMTAKGYLRTSEKERFKPRNYKYPVATNHAIYERDKWMVENCDVLYCDFTGTGHALIGCLFELAWASMLGKHTITVIPRENIHQHAFVLEASDICFGKTEEALDYLEYLILGKIE
jgi:nucleoside 2-deoxyribosyltransferase